ncbi:hypothetical protein [Hoeflea marina]|nr:hypothetical protein [Hoeflea marina]
MEFPIKAVHLDSQSDDDRLAMIMMQLDMALALARENKSPEVARDLEKAMAKARKARDRQLN